ncbi:MAG: ATP-binding cassette domain-containing protein [Candidatus Korarchaeota archaeon]|nr:ATP-binding cassette domain-containing protein [Candidatus Korarchaeota archaeon]NIU84986.1 ATP-binding cassette domain-containing protein [Candidatus Thorarchaeota archaeon]NIW15008.1 ATP-binding cassette domain-containing protein [Candidatus Thorarchaeota archaeon]NIW53018.1 ATP-binding cassette domain-containing protein [Candidatus Korarchaeota archaeon]
MRPDLLHEDEDHPLFHLDNVGFEIHGASILSNITVEIIDAGITGIIGPSGSGKSTLLRLLNKLISPSYGSIFFRGTWFGRIPT